MTTAIKALLSEKALRWIVGLTAAIDAALWASGSITGSHLFSVLCLGSIVIQQSYKLEQAQRP
jgi:hypothetical protein